MHDGRPGASGSSSRCRERDLALVASEGGRGGSRRFCPVESACACLDAACPSPAQWWLCRGVCVVISSSTCVHRIAVWCTVVCAPHCGVV